MSNTQEQLRSVIDFTDAEFQAELARVTEDMAIERNWTGNIGVDPFEDEGSLRYAEATGDLVPVDDDEGYRLIFRLAEFGGISYSPPLLRPNAYEALRYIGRAWNEQASVSDDYLLSVTSMVRSLDYQRNLTQIRNKLALPVDSWPSSHTFGLAFDIDACGLYRKAIDGSFTPVNPRSPHYEAFADDVESSRSTLNELLSYLASKSMINFVEELPGTQEHCFHICANPNY